MKRYCFFALMALLPALNPLPGQNLPVSLQDPEKKSAASLSTIEGSYPQDIDWFKWIPDNWVADKKVSLTYAGFGEPLTEIWDYETENDRKLLYTYDNQHLLLQVLQQEKIDNTWTDRSRTSYEYDSYGQMTTNKQELYDAGVWFVNRWTKNEYEMDNGKLSKLTTSKYDGIAGGFVYETRTTHTYDNDGLLSTTITEDYNDGVWLNKEKSTRYWISEGREDYVTIEIWVETDWMKMFKIVYNWTGNRSFSFIMYVFNNNTNEYDTQWVRGSHNYDQHENMILEISEAWNNGAWEITMGQQYDISYEGDHAVQRISKIWDYAESIWKNVSKEVFKNFINLGIQDPVILSVRLDCYPNPFTDYTVINFTPPLNDLSTITIFDMGGRAILSLEVTGSRFILERGHLERGLYLLQLKNKDGAFVQKIIAQ